MSHILDIADLKVSVAGNPILKGASLKVKAGEVHCIMGPNGSGKSTFVNVIMGHPAYEVHGGSVKFDNEELLDMESFERARRGLFLAFQYPKEIAGVSVLNFLTAAYNAHRSYWNLDFKPVKSFKFKKVIEGEMKKLDIDPEFLGRFINQGFSGGEKKKAEILQMKVLKPKFALLDETDSGLDVDALKVVAQGINSMRSPDFGVLMVTHYQRILEFVEPDFVHVMKNGRIVRSGGKDFAKELEEKGYANY